MYSVILEREKPTFFVKEIPKAMVEEQGVFFCILTLTTKSIMYLDWDKSEPTEFFVTWIPKKWFNSLRSFKANVDYKLEITLSTNKELVL